MDRREGGVWPLHPRTSIIASILILFALLFVVVILRVALDWPSPESEPTVLLGIFLLSLVPILLVLVNTLVEQGGVVEYRGLKIDFSQAQRIEARAPTIPANIGVPGQAVSDSGTHEILEALRQAATSEIIIVDLEEGQAWWETRLLVLIAGAVRLHRPRLVVFVGTDGGTRRCFLGWSFADALLPHLLQAHPRYSQIYHATLAAARRWELVEPQGPNIQPPLPVWMQEPANVPGIAGRHPWMAFDYNTGLPNRFFAEQLLASELGAEIEQAEPPRTVSAVRLEDLFRPVLHKEHVDESWSSEHQLDAVFASDVAYIALTQNGQYKALISRMSVLNMMVRALAKP